MSKPTKKYFWNFFFLESLNIAFVLQKLWNIYFLQIVHLQDKNMNHFSLP